MGEEAMEMFVLIQGNVGVYFQDESKFISVLGSNSIFGERGMSNLQHVRTASIKALEHTYCLKITKQELQDRVYFYDHKLSSLRVSFFLTLPFTKNWTKNEVFRFDSCIGILELKTNDLLYDIGQSAEVIYIVFNGLLTA